MFRQSRLMKMAKENLEENAEVLTPEEIEQVEADTTLEADAVRELDMAEVDIEQGYQDVAIAEADQEGLENTAELLNSTLEEDGQGADPVALELASDEIAVATERYALGAARSKFARESVNTVASRKQVTRALAAEAEEKAAGIGKRIQDGLKALYEMFVEFVKNLLDKSYRYAQRAKKMRGEIGSATFVGGKDTKVKLSVVKAEGGSWPKDFGKAADAILKAVNEGKNAAKDVKYSGSEKTEIGTYSGTTFAFSREGDSVSLVTDAYEAEGFFKTVEKAGAFAIVDSVIAALEGISKAKKDFDELSNGIKKKASASNEENKAAAANLRTFSKAATTISRAVVNAAGQGLSIVQQSMAGKKDA